MTNLAPTMPYPWRWRVKPNVGVPALPPPGEPMDDGKTAAPGYPPAPKPAPPDSITNTTV